LKKRLIQGFFDTIDMFNNCFEWVLQSYQRNVIYPDPIIAYEFLDLPKEDQKVVFDAVNKMRERGKTKCSVKVSSGKTINLILE
tara:strand:+ start:50158 stop:50409 length:252 start_codon:yes stop_codon:yes gene_type:complete